MGGIALRAASGLIVCPANAADENKWRPCSQSPPCIGTLPSQYQNSSFFIFFSHSAKPYFTAQFFIHYLYNLAIISLHKTSDVQFIWCMSENHSHTNVFLWLIHLKAMLCYFNGIEASLSYLEQERASACLPLSPHLPRLLSCLSVHRRLSNPRSALLSECPAPTAVRAPPPPPPSPSLLCCWRTKEWMSDTTH